MSDQQLAVTRMADLAAATEFVASQALIGDNIADRINAFLAGLAAGREAEREEFALAVHASLAAHVKPRG